MKKAFLLLLSASLLSGLNAKNLKIAKTISPFNYEQIDIEIEGDVMIIPAGLGGAELYDISDPLNPSARSNLLLRTCRWERTYNWDIGEGIAIGTARECGFAIYGIGNRDNPVFYTKHNPNNDFLADGISNERVSAEDVEIVGDIAVFAAHASGLLFYDVSSPATPKYLNRIRTGNAWSLAIKNDRAYVADGEFGMAIISIKNVNTPLKMSEVATSGAARDIRIVDDLAFIAVGNAGIDVFDVSNPSEPQFLTNYETRGFTSRVAVHLPYVSASSWEQLNVLKWDGSQLKLHGYKNTGGRVMAVGSPGGDVVYSAEWELLKVFQVADIAAADIDLSTRIMDFGKVEIGDSKTLSIDIENNGGAELHISAIGFTYDEFSVESSDFTVAPKSKETVDVVYTPLNTSIGGNMILFTNDPDEDQVFVRMAGNNSNEVQEGDVARNFVLPIIANGSGELSLAELRGRVVVLAQFASW